MRYTDKNIALDSTEDFMLRERIPTLGHLGLFFVTTLVFVCGAYVVSRGSLGNFAAITGLLLAGAFAAVIWTLQRTRDELLITEFQNTLYSSSLSVNNLLCVISRRDGILAHVDGGFRLLFPSFDRSRHRTLQEAMDVASMSREDADKILTLIETASPGQQVVTVKNTDGLPIRLMLSVDPLRRPREYCLLRARPFVESRGA